MGHSSRTCRLSGVPITSGVKAVLVPLIPTGSWYDNSEERIRKFGKEIYLSNEGAEVFFVPLFLPIFGSYDGYGGLEDIIEDDNTKVLEKHFGLTIQEIVDIICSLRKDDGYSEALKPIKKKIKLAKDSIKGEKHFDKYQRITGDKMPCEYPDVRNGGDKPWTIVRNGKRISATKEEYDADFKLIHEHYARYKKWAETNPDEQDDYGKPQYEDKYQILIKASAMWMRGEVYEELAKAKKADNYFDKVDIGTPAILKALGFKETTSVLTSIKNAINSNRERYNRTFVNGPVTLKSDGNWVEALDSGNLYSLSDLKKYCKKKGLDLDISEINNKGMYEQIYDYIVPETKKIDEPSRWEGDRIRRLFLSDKWSPGKFSEVYFKAVKKEGNGFLRSNLIDWHKVFDYFYITGHFLSPVSTSPQDGEPRDVLTLVNISKKVLEADLKERGYDEEEEFEEEEESN
jgi:hypothetical protein